MHANIFYEKNVVVKADIFQCNKLCGDGKQLRSVRCYRKVDGKIEVLPDNQCPEKKPDHEQTCMIHPCEGVDWILSEWSGVSENLFC